MYGIQKLPTIVQFRAVGVASGVFLVESVGACLRICVQCG